MSSGYKPCRGCGELTNCVELVSGFCPECAKAHVRYLSDLQRQYQAAVDAGDADASEKVASLIFEYQHVERVRLKDALRPNPVRGRAQKSYRLVGPWV